MLNRKKEFWGSAALAAATLIMNGNLLGSLMIAAVALIVLTSPARSATATYVIPANISNAELAALSTQGDSSGYMLALNQTLAIVLDTPIGATSGGRVSVFTLPPNTGAARATIRIGSYNAGSPQIVFSRNVRAGRVRNLNNLFNRGCGLLGGCNYIEIITTRTRRGAPGVEIDYIEVDGELVQVTSPTPEPESWAMMILGFAITAFRLKSLRRAHIGRRKYCRLNASPCPS